MTSTGYLGLGSNVGDRLARLREVPGALGRRGIRVLRRSPVYETAAVEGAAGERDFLNACLEIETALGPEDLLEACKATEEEIGRAPGERRHGPRAIDVDVLLLGDTEHRSERLEVPHPAILERRFVLVPLLDLDPELRLPDGTRLAAALAPLRDQRVARVGTL